MPPPDPSAIIDRMKRRGRRVAIWMAGLGLLVILGAGYAARDRILEEWWLYRLEHGDEDAKRAAAERLGKMNPVLDVPTLLRSMRATAHWTVDSFRDRPQPVIAWDASGGAIVAYEAPESCRCFQAALIDVGTAALPELIGALDGEDTVFAGLCAGAIDAICADSPGVTLVPPVEFIRPEEMGSLLGKLAKDPGQVKRVRQAAAKALVKIEDRNVAKPLR